jgi:hypothetical protein
MTLIETDTPDSTTTDTEPEPEPSLEPSHVFEARIATRLQEATDAAATAAAAEQAASDLVTTKRGDHALGLIDKGRLLVAQRSLAKLQEARATADAKVKAVERWVARERAARHEIEMVVARRERVDREAVKAASQVEARRLWAEIWSNIDKLDTLEGLPPLKSAGASYDRAMATLSNLYRLFVVDAR